MERHLLNLEKKTKDSIKRDYAAALSIVKQRIAELTEQYEQNPELRSKIYQRQYQQKLQVQLKAALNGLADKNMKHTADFLENAYQAAFIGADYNIKAEGYDIFIPLDRQRMTEAIYRSSGGFRLSKSVYDGDIDELRKKLQGELSRGLNAGMDYATISRMAASKCEVSYSSMKRIIATEGHRVQNEAKMACMYDAKAAGADIVKEWSATMDAATRERHQILDGQIRELEDAFTALGAEAQYPGGFGIASEDINCRCCLLQRARRALSDKQRKELESYAAYRKQYIEKQNALREFRISTSSNAGNVTKERISVMNVLAGSPERVQKCLNDTKIEIGRIGASAYDYEKDIMYIARGAEREEIIHEIGHAVEKKLIDNEKVDILLSKTVEGLTIDDISMEIFYDANNKPKNIFVVHSDKFISEYQGRIYVNDILAAKNMDGSIRYEYMYEYISEGYREYIMNSTHLKGVDPELYELIEEAIND